MPIDAVLYADTGMEFPEMYDHIARLDDYLYRERGLRITTLRHPKGFEWLMFENPIQKESSIENRNEHGVPLYGNGWPGPKVRWCTGQLKTHLIDREVNRLKAEKHALHYVGIAADEAWRCKEEQYPLVDWGITEAEALQICYDRGYDWDGLYEIYHRCSCWCCPLQKIGELKKLRQHHPELWNRLRDLDRRAKAQFGMNPLGRFKQGWTVEMLELRFSNEEAQLSLFDEKTEEEKLLVRFAIDEAHRIMWYDNWIGYEEGDTAVVDNMFQSPELEEQLERLKLKPLWKPGIYEYVSAGKLPIKKVAGLKRIRVWQQVLRSDAAKLFLSYKELVERFGEPDSDNYILVFDGELETNDLEEIYSLCNGSKPYGYVGRYMSMGDIVELYDDKSSAFYYCDRTGFQEFEFAQKEPLQAHGHLIMM